MHRFPGVLSMNTLHIVGPPGCGKTHELMGKIRTLIQHGIPSAEIAFTSFTKSAIEQARERTGKQFGLQRHDLPFFGTLHSLAYRHLMLTRDNQVTGKRWKAFCEEARLAHSEPGPDVDDDPTEPVGQEEGDVLRRFYDWRRNCLLSPEEAARRFDPGDAPFSLARAIWFEKEFGAFKDAAGLYDFTDMLLEMDAGGWCPAARVLIVDEAQDLSPLQRRITLRWMEQIGHVLLAYDEDQAIYTFQGAEPAWLLALEGRREFLQQSYRVPQLPAGLAQRIIRRNSERYPKTWNPKAEKGMIAWDVSLDDAVLAASRRPRETWYFLARNRFYLTRYCEALKEAAVPYRNLRGPSPQVSGAVLAALQLAAGQEVTLDDIRRLGEHTTQREWWVRGAKADITRRCAVEAQAKIGLADLENLGALPALCSALAAPRTCLKPLKGEDGSKVYFLAIWQKHGIRGLTDPPTVTVSTMHGVKGGGARNVVISPMMTRKTWDSYDTDPEPERRVWYVGVSRTEENLYILEPTGGKQFEDW